MQPRVAIVGRPNVGKSTLFNMLAHGAARAVTHDLAGTTRDVRTTPAELFGLQFLLLDTAGIEESRASTSHTLQAKLNVLAMGAAAQADLLVFVLDGAHGILPADRALAQSLRKLGKPVILVLNKTDLKTAQGHASTAETLGFGRPVLMSAAHSQGLDSLYEALAEHIPHTVEATEAEEDVIVDGPRKSKRASTKVLSQRGQKKQEQKEAQISNLDRLRTQTPGLGVNLAPAISEAVVKNNKYPTQPEVTRLVILGRPNVGKSTLINTLLKSEAMLTGPEAGLTREAITHDFAYKGHQFLLTDTPGLRRKGKVEKEGVEFLSVGQSLQAAENADIVVLVVDASGHNLGMGKWEIFEQQDAQIAMMIMNQFKPIVIALAKWDLVEDPVACLADVTHQLHHKLHAIHTPLAVPLSSLKGRGIKTLLDAVVKAQNASYSTFSTGKLNNLLNRVLAKKSPPLANGKVVSLKFIRQTGTNPPSFTFWGNRIDEVANSYKQFLRHQLAEALGLIHNPVNIYFRANSNPFHSSGSPRKWKRKSNQ